MANLEETHEAELDDILGELSLLEQRNGTEENAILQTTSATNDGGIAETGTTTLTNPHGRTHSRSNSTISGATNSSISISSESGTGSGSDSSGPLRESRTDSPDNDSAFSDTVSLLSSESSASSGVSSSVHTKNLLPLNSNLIQVSSVFILSNLIKFKKSLIFVNSSLSTHQCDSAKAAKIHLALQKLEQASVRRLFVKAFTCDGASKSLLVDERMTCGHVTRLLADKNHIQMEPHWALVEHLPDLQMGE